MKLEKYSLFFHLLNCYLFHKLKKNGGNKKKKVRRKRKEKREKKLRDG